MATIEQRSPHTWRIGVRLGVDKGREWIRQTLEFPESMTYQEQKRQVDLAVAKLTLDAANGNAVPSHAMTVEEFSNIWITDHVKPDCSPQTLKQYTSLLHTRIIPELGAIKLQQLNAYRITQFLNSVKADTAKSTAIPAAQRKRKADKERPEPPARNLSKRTIRHYYDVLNYMLNKAVQWGMLFENPMKKVDRPKARRAHVKYLDDEQAVELLRRLGNEKEMSFRAAVLLALLCGLRLGEVGALKLSDVNWDRCEINVSRALGYTPETGNYTADPKTDAGFRVVSLPAGMMTLLHECRLHQEETAVLIGDRWKGDGHIVCSWDGLPLHHDTPSKQFRRFADRNGFEGVTFHGLRHTHATILFANNVDAVTVAKRLGHEDPSTTFRFYADAIRRRDRDSAIVMQNLFDRALSPAAPTTPAEPSPAPVVAGSEAASTAPDPSSSAPNATR